MANILAVDDNLELCKLIRTTLERDGHRAIALVLLVILERMSSMSGYHSDCSSHR